MFDYLKGSLSKVTVCSPGLHRVEKPIVIMSAMHISVLVLEAQQGYTAWLMSLTGSGSLQVGGGSSFMYG